MAAEKAERRLERDRLDGVVVRLLVDAAPDRRRRPAAARVRDRRGGARLIAGLELLRFGQIAERRLRAERRNRRDHHAHRFRVQLAAVEVPSLFVGLRAVERARFEADGAERDAGGDHVAADVRGVLEVMAERRLRDLAGRVAMRKSDRPERGIADRREVQVSERVTAERVRVLHGQLHEEIVRMLPVDELLAERGLAGLKQLRILAARDGRRLEAEHGPQQQMPSAERPLRGDHHPVGGELFLAAARTGGAQIVERREAVQHQMPRAFHEHHVLVLRRRIGVGAPRLLHQEVARVLGSRGQREEREQQSCPNQ